MTHKEILEVFEEESERSSKIREVVYLSDEFDADEFFFEEFVPRSR